MASMDPRKFDELIKNISTTRVTRLTALRGLVAGAAAAVAGASLASDGLAKKAGRTRSSKKRSKVRKAAAAKTEICHLTSSPTNPFVIINVSDNAAEAGRHLRHGDAYRGDCCVDSECSELTDQCNVGRCVVDTTTNEGNCAPVPTPGVTCDDDFACTTGDTCDANGDCVGTTDDSLCDDGFACTTNTCDPTDENSDADGCVYTPDTGDPCDDGDICTTGETCQADGTCGGGTANPECGRTCTASSQCGPNQCCCRQQGRGTAGRCVGTGCTRSSGQQQDRCCLGQNRNNSVPPAQICPA